MKRIAAWSRPILDLFNDWFVSDSGVWQTLIVCLAAVTIEFAFPRLDPHAFLLMAVLTVYSGITQPALARAGRVAGERQEQMLVKLEALEEQLAALITTVASDETAEALLVREIHQQIVAARIAD